MGGRLGRTGVGGPQAPAQRQDDYGSGAGKVIDSMKPFRLAASVEGDGGLTIRLRQGSGARARQVISFDKQMAGNP